MKKILALAGLVPAGALVGDLVHTSSRTGVPVELILDRMDSTAVGKVIAFAILLAVMTFITAYAMRGIPEIK